MQNLGILCLQGSFFFSIMLLVSKMSINSSIGLTLMIVYSKIVLGELLSQMDLLNAQIFRIYKIAQVVMVCKNKNLMLTIL